VHTEPNSKYLSESVSLVGDAAKAKSELGWSPSVTFRQLVHSMVDADIDLLAHGGTLKFEESER
jgi:GDPmannose 4,6-dehydratase